MHDDGILKEALRQTVSDLTDLDGAPGFEQMVIQYLVTEFEATGANVEVDSMGNLYARYGATDSGPHLMVAAHADEIGAVVRHIDENGFLYIDPLGGLLPVHLVAQRVRVGGHLGVVGVRPGHLQAGDDPLRVPALPDLFIDVGAANAAEVADLGIRIGSSVTYATSLATFSNPDRLTGKAIDNRLGCAVLLQLFRQLAGETIAGQLTALVAVQEEVGFRGATVGAYRVRPDYALVVDTFPVGDTPGVPKGRMPAAIGQGPVLVLAASSGRSGRGHIVHPRVEAWLERAAAAADVPVQRATSIGIAISDAAAVHLSRDGIPTGVVGLPRRYSHSPICTFDLNDSAMAVTLLHQFASQMTAHTNLTFFDEIDGGV